MVRLVVLLFAAGAAALQVYPSVVRTRPAAACSVAMQIAAPTPIAVNVLQTAATFSTGAYLALSRPGKTAVMSVSVVVLAFYMNEKRKQTALIDSGEVCAALPALHPHDRFVHGGRGCLLAGKRSLLCALPAPQLCMLGNDGKCEEYDSGVKTRGLPVDPAH